ncbi:MAG: UDP-N-acetylmuramoyl-tripeptide--D-alanyl-D-alanine ligase [Desulfonauticus sp.]|nr:UDP-N-acetylmuramoyl-tripeptide--D-alanyl-D-alanine ligase [Desulfonauticus sp.]
MLKLSLEDIVMATKAIVECDNLKLNIRDIKTDSRILEPGDVFVCLEGNRFDGHDFARQAIEKGAIALIVHRPLDFEPNIPCLLVNDTVKALGDIARFIRNNTNARVIALTGSVGKTTTKEMLFSILSQKFKIGKSRGNWNNQIGVPLSIFQFEGDEDIWLLEVGINNQKDMDELGDIIWPDIAIILNAGTSHLKGLGNKENVALHKCKLLKYVKDKGCAFINADNIVIEKSKPYNLKKIYVSKQDKNLNVKFLTNENNKGIFLFTWNGKKIKARLPFVGEQFEENIRFAMHVGKYFGLQLKDIILGLEDLTIPGQRFKIFTLDGWTVIDDTYNANPMSMRASILTAKQIAQDQPLILVLGDMKELGDYERIEHEKLGLLLRTIQPALVFYKGKWGEVIKNIYQDNNFFVVNSDEEFISFLKNYNFAKGIILFKASRSLQLEQFVNRFRTSVLKNIYKEQELR